MGGSEASSGKAVGPGHRAGGPHREAPEHSYEYLHHEGVGLGFFDTLELTWHLQDRTVLSGEKHCGIWLLMEACKGSSTLVLGFDQLGLNSKR